MVRGNALGNSSKIVRRPSGSDVVVINKMDSADAAGIEEGLADFTQAFGYLGIGEELFGGGL